MPSQRLAQSLADHRSILDAIIGPDWVATAIVNSTFMPAAQIPQSTQYPGGIRQETMQENSLPNDLIPKIDIRTASPPPARGEETGGKTVGAREGGGQSAGDPSVAEIALANCDREPVHISGRIQAWGSLVGFDIKSGQLLYTSQNLRAMYPGIDRIDLTSSYDQLFDEREVVHAIRGALSLPSISTQRDRVGQFSIHGIATDVGVYTVDGVGVIELEPNTFAQSKPQSAISVTHAMLSTLSQSKNVVEFLNSAVSALRQVSGHDRVMAYRFLENGDGEVVAEAKSPALDPFFGLRYPASDIPVQVRQIMLRAPFRFIQDIESEVVEIVSNPGLPPLDLTLSHLRSVSPIHIEYLQNMGVPSTMNVSIIVHGKLWGIFAFHHHRRRRLSPDQRSICELFGHFASLQLQQTAEREKMDRQQRTRSTISATSTAGQSVSEAVEALHTDLTRAIRADGIALIHAAPLHSNPAYSNAAQSGTPRSDQVQLYGETPDADATQAICQLSGDELVAINSLAATRLSSTLAFGKSAGVLALKVDAQTTIAFFRNEVIHEIRWAGQPEKEILVGPNGPRLTPRASFDEYTESQSGRCREWDPSDILAARDIGRSLQMHLLNQFHDENQSHQRQKRYQDLLIAELNHRVRNTLSLVRSIARQTGSSSTSLEHYVESFERRITALSKSHDLVGSSGLQWAFLDDLLDAELRSYKMSGQAITTTGHPVALSTFVAPVISLLIHELVTNAARHGGLSTKGESLEIEWAEQDGGLAIWWTERLNEPVRKPDVTGFGMTLIERAIPHECHGTAEVEYAGHEYRVRFWLPAEAIMRGAERSGDSTLQAPIDMERTFAPFSQTTPVLVVEDNLVLAMELERTLRDLGFQAVETASNIPDAIEALERIDFCCAILDIHLGSENSLTIAERLIDQNVPAIFASGYDVAFDLPDSLASLPRLTKPIGRLELAAALSHILDEH